LFSFFVVFALKSNPISKTYKSQNKEYIVGIDVIRKFSNWDENVIKCPLNECCYGSGQVLHISNFSVAKSTHKIYIPKALY